MYFCIKCFKSNKMQATLLERQNHGIDNEKNLCITSYGISSLVNFTSSFYNETLGTLMCPAYFDTILCWPPTPINTTATATCPGFVVGFDPSQSATKKCMENGEWYKNNSIFWTNYTSCFKSYESLVAVSIDYDNFSHKIAKFLPAIKTISKTGYAVSFLSLCIAFLIILSIKKLQCPRNRLHMHLFASFILRAFIFFLKDYLFENGVGLTSDVRQMDGRNYFYENKESGNWDCKLVTSLFQFFITANYSWILMEGLYLHSLIFSALFADSNRSITPYVIMGWGVPMLVTIVWVIARLLLEDTLCWTTHQENLTFLIIRIPTSISILLNLFLFVRITIVIYSKLQAPVYEEAKRYQKWARSTLVLAPLFGIHYALLWGMSLNKNETIEIIWLINDQLFASFQGFFVAILYCFLNSEVRTELKPHIHNFLLFIATHNYFKYCFPCRNNYLRSAKGRASVCTTMSCSSLCNNGLNHQRNSRTKLEFLARNKGGNTQDRNNTYRQNWQESSLRLNKPLCQPKPVNKHCTFVANDEKIHLEKTDPSFTGECISMLPRDIN